MARRLQRLRHRHTGGLAFQSLTFKCIEETRLARLAYANFKQNWVTERVSSWLQRSHENQVLLRFCCLFACQASASFEDLPIAEAGRIKAGNTQSFWKTQPEMTSNLRRPSTQWTGTCINSSLERNSFANSFPFNCCFWFFYRASFGSFFALQALLLRIQGMWTLKEGTFAANPGEISAYDVVTSWILCIH